MLPLESRGCGTSVRASNAPQAQMVSVATSAAICALHLIESLPPLSFSIFSFPFFLFFLREENCGKYFVFPGSQAMYLLQVLLNEL